MAARGGQFVSFPQRTFDATRGLIFAMRAKSLYVNRRCNSLIFRRIHSSDFFKDNACFIFVLMPLFQCQPIIGTLGKYGKHQIEVFL